MLNPNIYEKRISQLILRIGKQRYNGSSPLTAEFIYNPQEPIPYEKALQAEYKPITPGTPWGEAWGSAWFRFKGRVPKSFAGQKVVALIDLGSEGCVFENGTPTQGITNKPANGHYKAKRQIPISAKADGGEDVSLLIEAAANELMGITNSAKFTLNQAELVCLNENVCQLFYDMITLESLMKAGEPESPRRRRLLHGLNQVANLWKEGKGIKECLKISAQLLTSKSDNSALTAYSVGHAHLDLGWLWPVRETKRKAGRTFSSALRLMEEYPEYIFGASQPQLYEWVKKDYPALFEEIRKQIQNGRWECQGGMWVEPDTNISGGEALVRQCLYGKKFFREEFGIDVKDLWLPDVFGYSAALPQILKKSGIDFFVSQKISWSDTNEFPHHTFMWEGIDGTEILSHFLPTHTYNCTNSPTQMKDAERRYKQNDISDDFLNLYGLGDGGGGPSRSHLETGIRMKDMEGVPKFKFSKAEDFYKKISAIPYRLLPRWVGELYLELHRGTYTTQSKMKRFNRLLELRLRDTEFLCLASGKYPKEELDKIWKNTMLNQFHDILPGSSIGMVYDQAHAESENNLKKLLELRDKAYINMHGAKNPAANTRIIYNTLSWPRSELTPLPHSGEFNSARDCRGNYLPVQKDKDCLKALVTVPPMGYTTIQLDNNVSPADIPSTPTLAEASKEKLENHLVKVTLENDGTFSSIFDKETGTETLSGPANLLLLWEDHPVAYDAWDINNYYRETVPEQAVRNSLEIETAKGLEVTVIQKFTIGEASSIEQRISLSADSKMVEVYNRVNWKERKKMLRSRLNTTVKANEATYEIQFGLLKRATHKNTSWDQAKFETPGHRFADLSREDYGIALINDCKYGYHAGDRMLELNLLRSTIKPDKNADRGEHHFSYAYLPHVGRLENSNVLRMAHAFNTPLLTATAGVDPVLPAEKCWYNVASQGVVIETVKKAEKGEGTIVRLYETRGAREKVIFQATEGWEKLSEVNLIEEEIDHLQNKGTSCEMTFNPFEIRTLLLS